MYERINRASEINKTESWRQIPGKSGRGRQRKMLVETVRILGKIYCKHIFKKTVTERRRESGHQKYIFHISETSPRSFDMRTVTLPKWTGPLQYLKRNCAIL